MARYLVVLKPGNEDARPMESLIQAVMGVRSFDNVRVAETVWIVESDLPARAIRDELRNRAPHTGSLVAEVSGDMASWRLLKDTVRWLDRHQ